MNLLALSPNWLGDAVMALPALADLRRHFDSARLTVAARRSVAPLFEMVEGVDGVLTLPGRGGMASLVSWRQDAAVIGGGAFDVAVLFPNSFAAALAVSRAGVPEIWGYRSDRRARLLTKAVARPRGPLHQAAYYQGLVEGLGVTPGSRHARVTPPPAGPDGALGVAAPYVVFAPGAAYGRAKQWPPNRFAQLAGLLDDGSAVNIVLVGSAADAPVCREIGRLHGGPLLDLSGRTNLQQLAAVLAGARAVVSNDSGAMHLAGAVGARVIAVFGSTNEKATSPLTSTPEAPPPIVVTADAWCRPCMLRECPIDHRCMTGITARDVASAIGAATA